MQDTCELEKKTYEGWTALHLAALEGHIRCVENLVGYGASLETTDPKGSTALHMVLGRRNMKPLSDWTLHLNEVNFTVTHAPMILHS